MKEFGFEFLEPQSFPTNTNMVNWLGLHKPQQGWIFKQQQQQKKRRSAFICQGHLVTISGSVLSNLNQQQMHTTLQSWDLLGAPSKTAQ